MPCPICQEKFEVSRNEELQDFVWMDAVKIGGRVYHATCYADLKKDGGNTPARTATPDSVLGKRKAEASC
jgi:pre-mRNA cleavage complex 2 protein Pcf11